MYLVKRIIRFSLISLGCLRKSAGCWGFPVAQAHVPMFCVGCGNRKNSLVTGYAILCTAKGGIHQDEWVPYPNRRTS